MNQATARDYIWKSDTDIMLQCEADIGVASVIQRRGHKGISHSLIIPTKMFIAKKPAPKCGLNLNAY